MKEYSYKGFKTKIDFDPKEGIFYGSSISGNIRTCFHGETVEEAEQMFRQGVDNVLDYFHKKR